MNPITLDLTSDRAKIAVYFEYDPQTKDRVKSCPGSRFVPWHKSENGTAHWTVPLKIDSGIWLREQFGDKMTLKPELITWARQARREQEKMQGIALADDFPLVDLKLTQYNSELAHWFRPYQRADVFFLAQRSALNLNEQGLGKTSEIIGAVQEAGLRGPHLVACPRTAIESVWKAEIERFDDSKVFASEDSKERQLMLQTASEMYHNGKRDFWFITTYDMIRFKGEYEYDEETGKKTRIGMAAKFDQLFDITWDSFTIDEYHKSGMCNDKTLAANSFRKVKSRRVYPMTGTPVRGKPVNLFYGLRAVAPQDFTSKWQWAERWLEIESNYMGHKTIGGIRKGLEDAFYKHMAPYALRRLKSEVLPQLPPKQRVDVWTNMTKKQAAQYDQFAKDAEIRIEEEHLTATNVLAEYARLKMFATACCGVREEEHPCPTCAHVERPDCDKCGGVGRVTHLKLTPDVKESGKIARLVDMLAEIGIDPGNMEGDAVAVVGSQHKETVDAVHAYLNEIGIPAEKITGDTTKKGERQRIIKAFQDGGPASPRVIVMTTGAGGVAITLDRADTIHILDETWVPDDQEQLEDRIHRASRIHQVTAYYYRSRDTIEEYIYENNIYKSSINRDILDLRRQGLRATMRG